MPTILTDPAAGEAALVELGKVAAAAAAAPRKRRRFMSRIKGYLCVCCSMSYEHGAVQCKKDATIMAQARAGPQRSAAFMPFRRSCDKKDCRNFEPLPSGRIVEAA